MISSSVDQLAERLGQLLPPELQQMREDVHDKIRAGLQDYFAKLDLVSREEFDVQSAVLQRTRERLESLETRLAELESKLAE